MEGLIKGACEQNRLDIVKHLIVHFENENMSCSMLPLLRFVAHKGFTDMFRLILSANSIDAMRLRTPNDADEMLLYAVHCNCTEIVNQLIDSGRCDINIYSDIDLARARSSPKQFGTVLSAASDPEIIRSLLRAKADVNPKAVKQYPEGDRSVQAQSCLMLQPACVSMLLEAGALLSEDDTNASIQSSAVTLLEKMMTTPCSSEKCQDQVDVINLLLKAGAKTRNLRGDLTALTVCMSAAHRASNWKPIIHTLLKHDPELLEVVKHGQTPLLTAITQRNALVVECLLGAGADLSARNADGLSVLFRSFITVLKTGQGFLL
jgi:ankyrin repeat protein